MIGVDRISKHTHELDICVIHNSNEVGRSATQIFDFLIFETDYSHSNNDLHNNSHCLPWCSIQWVFVWWMKSKFALKRKFDTRNWHCKLELTIFEFYIGIIKHTFLCILFSIQIVFSSNIYVKPCDTNFSYIF